MSSVVTTLVMVLFLLLPLFLHCSAQAVDGGQGGVPAVIAFGDSIVDTGNNNALVTIARCDFAPYGQDFAGHKATGRFSNGKVPSDMIVSVLGIKEYLPPYLTTEENEELLTGVSFASGGSGYDPYTAKALSVLSMSDQLDLFKKYKEKLSVISGDEKAQSIISDSLYVVCSGTNDVVNTYFTYPIRRISYDLPSYLAYIVQTASDFVQDLYKLGARKIGVVGLPPIGCLPSQRTFVGGNSRDCVARYNQVAITYNGQLSSELLRLRQILPGTKIIYIDIYDSLLRLMVTPSLYGFEEGMKGCCGTGNYELSFMCNNYTTNTCTDDAKYVFWDSFHPTERAYEFLVEDVKEKYLPLLV